MPWYEYSAQDGGQPRPIAAIRLRRGDRSVRLTALVDSGADFSLFDVTVADALGLDRRNAQLVENLGRRRVGPYASLAGRADGDSVRSRAIRL